MDLPTDVLVRAREIVVKMHRLGVAHGDVRPENMNYNFKTGRLYLYDFSDARTRKMLGEEGFRRACLQDLESLDTQIAWSKTDEAKRLKYVH